MNFLNSLSLQWKIILIVVIIIIIYLLYRKFGYRLKNLFQAKDIKSQQIILPNGEVVTVSTKSDIPASQKLILENLAEDLKKDIYGLNITHETELYKRASSLSDVEIDYLADYYKRYLTDGVSLYEDMNDEEYSCYVQDCTGVKSLLVKLEKTGNR